MSKWYTYETMKLRIKHADSKEELEFLGRLVKSLHEAHMLTDHKRVTLLDMISKRLEVDEHSELVYESSYRA